MEGCDFCQNENVCILKIIMLQRPHFHCPRYTLVSIEINILVFLLLSKQFAYRSIWREMLEDLNSKPDRFKTPGFREKLLCKFYDWVIGKDSAKQKQTNTDIV